MESKLIVFFVLHLVHFITCPYPPTGDEVVPGSVLLPASRRGRYLANIVRRQAVDGTGIKFNKDADRMNAEAKKKVDVLSDELLPYIIAEQERRTTLYKRLMTAIQNGEKGVTIAEIRNKSPLIIRKGVMFRCPANRAPKEPDGTGVLKCDEDIDPTQIMYDSCLSAEDKDLYVADNKYFFCNRHRIEGPDLPRNGSTVIGCAPTERTSLNYTTGKCALEDTDDVVVHYRYYPDRTYKFVTELDPDHEVCDHWNPCQIGYIYSLPGPDQALPATDLWRDEFVPPIPEDTVDEFVPKKVSNYTTSPRRIPFPKDTRRNRRTRRTRRDADENTEADADAITEADADASTEAGTEADADASTEADADASTEADADTSTEADADVSTEAGTEADADASTEAGADASTEASSGLGGSWRLDKIWAKRNSDGHGWNVQASHNKIKVIVTHDKNSITVMMYVAAVFPDLFSSYYVIFTNDQGQHVKSDKFLTISESAADVKPETVDVIPGQKVNNTLIPFDCYKCKVISVLVRTRIGDVHNCDPSKCSVKELPDKKQFIEIALDKLKPQDVGDFFIVFINVNAVEEKVKVLQVEIMEVAIKREDKSLAPGDHFDHNVKFECIGCELKDVTVNGHSAIEDGKAASSPASKTIIINFPSFDDFCAGVYIAIFIKNGRSYQKVIDVIDSVKVESPANVTGPSEGEQFETEIPYTCEEVCTVEAVTVNGLPLNTDATPCVESCMPGFVITTSNVINIKIPQFTIMFEGIFQAVFSIGGETNVTKTIMEITPSPDRGEGGDPNASPEETPPKEVSTELSPSGPSPSGPSIGGLPNINLVVNGGGGVNGGVIVDAGASIKGGVVIEGGASVNAGVVIEGGAVNAGVVVDGGVAVKGGIDIKGGINAGIGRKGAKRNGAKTTGAKKKGAKRTGAKTTATKKKGAKMTGSKRTGTKTTGTKKTGAKMTGAKTTGAKTTGAKTTPVGHVTGTTSATLSATTKASSEASTVSVKAS